MDGLSFSQIDTVGVNVESYTDTTLAPSTEYWFRVRAYNASGNSGYTNTANATTADSPPINTAPTISNISDQTIPEDGVTGSIAVSVGDAESSADSLTLSASSSNTSLVSLSGIVFGGSGSDRTVTITPSANESGTATITVTVSDGSLTASDSFIVTVSSVNDAPVISNIADTTVPEDGTTDPIAFTVSDIETAAGSLTVSGSSSNTSLVPPSGIVFSGSGSNRTVTVTPAIGQSGSTTITVTTSDGDLEDSATFSLTVTSDSEPTTIDYGLPSGGMVTLTPQDVGVVRVPGTTTYDSSNETFTVVAGGLNIGTSEDEFHFVWHQLSGDFAVVARVVSLSSLPEFAKAGIMIRESLDPDSAHAMVCLSPTGSVFRIHRNSSGADTSSDRADLAAPAWVRLERSGSFITASYSADGEIWVQFSQKSIQFSETVYVGLAATARSMSETFTALYSGYDVTALESPPVNTAPTISDIANRTILEDDDTGAIGFTVGDSETPPGGLTVSGSSSNTDLVPLSGIVFGGSEGNRTVTVTPASNQLGTATISVTVSDGSLSTTDQFDLTVTAAPEPVTVSVISPVEGASYTVGDTVSGEAITSDISRTATVEFFRGSTRINTERQSPYEFSWAPDAAGTYVIKAIVTDTDGATAESMAITITVNDPEPDPVAVSLIAPTDGSEFDFGSTIQMAASVSDASRTQKVEFYSGLTKVGEDLTEPYEFDWSEPTTGEQQVFARVIEINGESSDSSLSSITVREAASFEVTMTSPTDGASIVLGESITVSAVVDVDVANVDHIDFFANSTKIKTENLAPYQFSWTPDTVGSHVITARGYNLAGAEFDSGSVTLDVGNPPLSISLSNPSDGATYDFGETVSVTAEVSDLARTVRVELLVDGAKIGEDANAPFVILWSGAETGSHTLQLRAVDVDANSVVSQVVTINVGDPTLTVSFVQPSSDTVVEEGEMVILEAITSDTLRTAKVDFRLDGSVIGSVFSEPYRMTWQAQSKGTHIVQAEAHENNGKKALSKTKSITVTEPVLPPEIVVTSPTATDSLTVGDDVLIEAFVAANGTDVGRVEFIVNSIKVGQSNGAPYSVSWVPLEPGSYAIAARAVVPGGENVLSAPVTVNVEASTDPIDIPSGVYRGKFKKVKPGADMVDGGTIAEDEVTETGSFAIYVNEFGLMTFLGFDTDSGIGFSSKAIRIAEDGSFEIPGKARGLAGDLPESQVVPPFARGRIGTKGIEGIVDGTDITISGIMVNPTGPASSASGAYELMGVRSSNTRIQIIIGADGIAYAYSENEGVTTGDEVQVNLSGTGVYLASELLDLEVVINTVEGSAQGLFTSASGEVSSLMGLRDDIDPERRLLNISTRGSIGSGSNVMITGFVVSGTEPKTVLIRAIGPGLAEFGVSSHIADPVLDLIGENGTVSSNARWILGNFGSVIESASTRIGAFPLDPDSLDAALLVTVAPGRYSVVIRDASRNGGDALIEVYDTTDVVTLGSDLINISTRGSVGAGKNLIGGFVVTGNVPKRVLIRGIGPALSDFGVSDALRSTKLVLTQRVEGSNVLVNENTGWASSSDPEAIIAATESAGAFLLAPDSDDSALLLWLEPGVYTAEVQPGDPGATGTALVEVYQVD
jgi:regulation of enolase protein 1 (concanavalin A-like superfamily)